MSRAFAIPVITPRTGDPAVSELGLDPGLVRFFRRYAILSAAAAVAIGCLALLGWVLGITLLASLHPAWVAMKVNTAICLVLVGGGLYLALPNGDHRPAHRMAVGACAGIVTAIALVTLAEYIFGWDIGLDQFLIAEPPGATGTLIPGRMAPMTAVSFALVGMALLTHVTKRGGFMSTPLTLVAFLNSALVLIGYFLGAKELYTVAGLFTATALPTALAFLLLSSSLLVIDPAHGLLHSLASPRSGGSMLRRLLPFALLLPLVIVWLRLQGEAWRLFSTVEFGASAIAVANIFVLCGVLFWTAVRLDRSDAARLRGEAARRTAQYARSLIEASLDPLVTISPEGKITDVNAATEKTTGVLRNDLIGTDFSSYFTEPEKARAGYEQVFSKGYVTDYPLAIRHVSGRVIDVLYNASTYRDESGTVIGVFAAARDVTERKRAEDSLRTSEERYHTLVDTMNEGLLRVDENTTITYVNAQFARMLGHPESDLIGHSSLEFMDDASRGLIPAVVERRKAGVADRYELSWVTTDGKTLPTLISARPVFDENHQYRGSLSVVTDLTEIKRSEHELTRYREHLEELVASRTAELEKVNATLEIANKELEGFSYSVSHDLRTPLRAIDGFSRVLMEDYADKLDAEGQRVLNIVRSGAVKMGQLIDDILSFSRIGRQEIATTTVDTNALVQESLKELESAVSGRKVSFDIKPLPPMQGDPAMLRRVWINLLDNALKFTRPKPEAIIEVGGRIENGETVYYVRDNGVGFDMKYVEKLFGVFQRLHGPEEFPGTGIGLAIVKRVVARHGGRVWAEGKLNEGAAFYFAFPATEKTP